MKNNFHNNLKKTVQFFIVFFVAFNFNAFAQPDDVTFFNPRINRSRNRVITLNASGGNDARRIQNAIQDLSDLGGGVVILESGNYIMEREVQFRSNVHIEIDPGARLTSRRVGTMFCACGVNTTTNFSIVSRDRRAGNGSRARSKPRRFRVILTGLSRGANYRTIELRNATNFKMADFNVRDNFTRFATFGLLNGQNNLGQATAPSMGIIENTNTNKGNPGWGTVQIQAGNNILFRRLSGTGGITLRIESGADEIAQLDPADRERVKIDRIYGRQIKITDGRSALSLSPHTIIQGSVDVRGIVSTSSEFAVSIVKGFRSNSPNRLPQGSLPFGSFNGVIIRNVRATFGQNAQYRVQESRFYPCELRVPRVRGVGISTAAIVPGISRDSDNFRVGPSIAPALNEAEGPKEVRNQNGLSGDGTYLVDFSEQHVRATGFNRTVATIVRGNLNDFEECGQSVGDIGFVPRADRNTPNDKQNNAPKNLSIGLAENTTISMYPNPASNFVTVNGTNGEKVEIYSLSGNLIKSIQGSGSTTTVDISNLETGLYILQVGTKTFKLNKN